MIKLLKSMCSSTASEADFYELLAEYNALTKESAKEPTKACYHEWTEYIGLNEVFTYCKKCDAKKEAKP